MEKKLKRPARKAAQKAAPQKPPSTPIQEIDAAIMRLLDARARASRDGAPAADLPPAERRQLPRHLVAVAAGAFPRDAIERVFTEIDSACAALTHKVRIAYFGPEATYTHMAALRKFGGSADYSPYVTVHDVFHAISKEWADYGVVPIENSTGGMVHHTLDEFLDNDLFITAEIVLDIHQNLMSKHPLSKIRTVFSHPQGFQQCQIWLRERLPKAAQIEVTSTAEGARRALKTPAAAAIASELAAGMYGLPILGRAIEDYKGNRTRFIVLGRKPAAPTGHDKTSLLLSLKHRPGALYHALKPFSEANLNLTKIESRPTKRKAWEYYFFIDLQGHREEKKVSQVLKRIESLCLFFKILGSYPMAR